MHQTYHSPSPDRATRPLGRRLNGGRQEKAPIKGAAKGP